jgi:hypothetical protein
MIISHKYRFIFIKTHKTAGTSIELFLARACGADDVVTPISDDVPTHQPRNYLGVFNPIPETVSGASPSWRRTLLDLKRRRRYYNHASAALVRARTSRRVWDGYFKFCVERNPWDKTISHFHMNRARSGGTLDFSDFITTRDFFTDHALYTDPRDPRRVIVDRVVRYENLDDDLGQVLGFLGVPYPGSLRERAKAEHRRDRQDYREVYTPAQARTVESAFAREIEFHGYSFHDSAGG